MRGDDKKSTNRDPKILKEYGWSRIGINRVDKSKRIKIEECHKKNIFILRSRGKSIKGKISFNIF